MNLIPPISAQFRGNGDIMYHLLMSWLSLQWHITTDVISMISVITARSFFTRAVILRLDSCLRKHRQCWPTDVVEIALNKKYGNKIEYALEC